MKTTRAILAAFLVATLVAPVALAGAKITIKNNDDPSEGFNDPTAAAPVGGNTGTTVGAQRLIAFQKAAELWANILDSDAEIVIDAKFDPLDCDATSAVLGAAGPRWIDSDFLGAPVPALWYHGALVNRLAGEDREPTTNEINARFNSDLGKTGCLTGNGWYYGLDHNSGTKVDLLVVLLHEFGHGLGFSEFSDSDTGELIEGQNDAYGSFLFDNQTGKRWSQMSNAERLVSGVNTGHLVLDGANVVAEAPKFLDGNGQPRVVVATPASIAKTYTAAKAEFGASLYNAPVSGSFVLVTDAADGTGPSTTDGCTALTNAASVSGKIALVDRGTCTFVIKAKNAQSAGAIGLVVINNEEGTALPPLGGTDASVTIPVLGISKVDGATIRAQLAGGVTGQLELGPSTSLTGADSAGRPLVYAPNPGEPGSSTSHFDTSAAPNLLMEPAINEDLDSNVDLTEAYFRDAGWFAGSNMTVTMRDRITSDLDNDGKADPGDTIRYELSIANVTGAGATGVVLKNTPDANTTLKSGSVQTPNGSVTKGNGAGDSSVEIALTGLKPGATATAQFEVTVKEGIDPTTSAVTNQATLDGTNFEPVNSDDPDTGASRDATVTPLDLNPMKVDKTVTLTGGDADSSGGVTAGDTLSYVITLRNTGVNSLLGIVVDDTPDAATSIVAGSVTTTLGSIAAGNEAGATKLTVNVGSLDVGLSATIQYKVKVKSPIAPFTFVILNQASVTGSNFGATVSDDPRSAAGLDATDIGIQQPKKRPARK
ncbi:MAG: PA domain-containing protein [Thermoanaerobaculia bacterium]|jgi:uncharacterized repeat protein (TIGR01451 family)